MSASLVGSEMCIRDRCPGTTTRSTTKPTSAHVGARQLAAESPMRPMRAVSYTHLTLPTICSV
eukprot:8654569-Alexandrium_andersonii.AAC.1